MCVDISVIASVVVVSYISNDGENKQNEKCNQRCISTYVAIDTSKRAPGVVTNQGAHNDCAEPREDRPSTFRGHRASNALYGPLSDAESLRVSA